MFEIKKCQKLPPVKYQLHPKFGTVFSPHMFQMNIPSDDKIVYQGEIKPYSSELMSPATISFHYGQSIFEGLKVFRQKDGGVAAFRLDLHAQRFLKSAQVMAMPALNYEHLMQALLEFIRFEADNVPPEAEHSLYIRPMMIGRDEVIKVGRSKSYSFYILATLAGSYFHSGSGEIKPARVLVHKQFVRAIKGGLGEAKTAANYAASLGPQTHGAKLGCDQVLYLDAIEHRTIDELGGMNFFMVRNGELVTPKLNGAILHGVTRRSILDIAPQLGIKTHEVEIEFDQMVDEIKSGVVTEAFACGTAAVVSPIGEFVVQKDSNSNPVEVKLPSAIPVAQKVGTRLKAIQRGEIESPGNWLFR